MTALQFLAEWALRSSVLIASGALLLWALRVKDPSIRWAAWTAMLCASLAIPALTAALPKLPLIVMRAAPVRVEAPLEVPPVFYNAPSPPMIDVPPSDVQVEPPATVVSKPFDWARAAVMVYVLVALALLLRLCVGLVMSRRLLRSSRTTGELTEGIEIRESDRVATPVALGIARSTIVLPGDWRAWDAAKLNTVLAHERSHIRRRDPAVQLLSAIHRALLWHSPLSWFLHRRIVRTAEEASDDAALAVSQDRALYAQVLLYFMQRGVRGPSWQGVPMSRYGRADQRIHRILDGKVLSQGVPRWSLAAMLSLGLPLACVVAAAHPQSAPPAQATTAPAAPVHTPVMPPAPDALTVKPSGRSSGEVSAGPPPGGRLSPQMFHAKVVAMPFVLTEEVASPPDSKAFTKWTIARRSDGSTVHIDYLRGLTVRELTTRRIDYIDGSRVTVGDSVGMKITWPLLVGSEFTALRKSILDPPGNCVMSDRETLIGFREIWGQRVAILDSGPRPSSWDPANTMRITKSRALDLACEELGYSIEEVSHVDGSSKLMTRAKLVSLTLGEPDKSLFEVSSTLTESRPSQFWQRLMQISGVPTDADDIRQWSQEDRVYSGR